VTTPLADDRNPAGYDPDGTPYYAPTAQQLGLCGPRSDDPGVGPDAARHTPPADSPGARALVLASLAIDPSKHNNRERILYAEVQRLRSGLSQAESTDGPAESPGLPPASEWEQQMRAFLGKRVEVVLNEDPRKVVVGVLHGFDTDGQVRIADEDGSWGWAWPCLDIAVSVGPAEAAEPARTVNPELEVGASEVGAPGPHLVGADTPAMSMLLRRVREGMWTAEEAQATLLTWPNRAGATDATTGDAIAELVRRADTATAERDQLRRDMENTRLATDERVRDIQAETARREAGLFRALWRAIGRAPGTEKDLFRALHQLAALAGPATPTEETS
jgi:hypothetical protein